MQAKNIANANNKRAIQRIAAESLNVFGVFAFDMINVEFKFVYEKCYCYTVYKKIKKVKMGYF